MTRRRRWVAGVLTDLEREVFRLISEGKRDKQIARALGIPLNSVANHVFVGCEVLGAKTRCQAIAMLTEEKLKSPY